jgi:hypothetical protein
MPGYYLGMSLLTVLGTAAACVFDISLAPAPLAGHKVQERAPGAEAHLYRQPGEQPFLSSIVVCGVPS